jgi:hypothetical protein
MDFLKHKELRMDISSLRNNGAKPCQKAQDFCAKFETLQECWDACKEPSWMTWFAAACGVNTVPLAIHCARRVLPIWEAAYPEDPRPRLAIEAAEAALAGTGTQAEAAAAAAWAAAGAAAWAAAAAWEAGWAAAEAVSACDIIREFWPSPPSQPVD